MENLNEDEQRRWDLAHDVLENAFDLAEDYGFHVCIPGDPRACVAYEGVHHNLYFYKVPPKAPPGFECTGERRLPKQGEWFCQDGFLIAEMAEVDFTHNRYAILRPMGVAEEEEK